MEFESQNSAKVIFVIFFFFICFFQCFRIVILLFQVLTTEAVQGAKKFLAGLGRGGKFNVNQGEIPSQRMFKLKI
jgi:hypothetical protein